MTSFGRLAPTLRDNGFDPLPVAGKRPLLGRWTEPLSDTALAKLCGEHPGANVGVLCRGLIAVDIDIMDAETATQVEQLAVETLGPTPLVRIGQAPRRLLLYASANAIPSTTIKVDAGQVDILAAGRQFVAFGEHPTTAQPYVWRDGADPVNTAKSAVPTVSPHDLKAFSKQAVERFLTADTIAEARQLARPQQDRRTGLVTDGRDEHLRGLVYAAWRVDSDAAPSRIARSAWAEFAVTADISIPKHNGRGPGLWAYADALGKARHLVAKAARNAVKRVARARLVPHGPGADIPDSELAAFRQHCRLNGGLSQSAHRVSELMLDRLVAGRCTDAVGYLATRLGIAPRTVERARAELLGSGLWETGRRLGRRDQTAPYAPRVICVPRNRGQALGENAISGDGVTENVTQYHRGVGGDGGPPALISAQQSSDAVQLDLLPDGQDADGLAENLVAWTSGLMPEPVRIAYLTAKRRRAVRQEDVARAVGVSRPQLANALQSRRRRAEGLPNAFDLSPAIIRRLKEWLLAPDAPPPPAADGDQERAARPPHHRRGGRKRPTAANPALPSLRLFTVLTTGAAGTASAGTRAVRELTDDGSRTPAVRAVRR